MDENKPVPTFSVITVTFNAEAVLESTIKSVAGQTWPAVEHIIVDGASTDGTMEIVRRHSESISCVLSEPDNGLYDAMNKGIRMATGDYLLFLNAGDCLHSCSTLEDIVQGLPAGNLPDILYGETAIVDNQNHFLRMRRLQTPRQLTWHSFRMGMLVCHQSFFVLRALAEPYDLRYHYSADFDWCIRMMKKASMLHNVHLTVADFRKEGLTAQHHRASLIERFRIMVHHYGLFPTMACHLWFVIRLLIKK